MIGLRTRLERAMFQQGGAIALAALVVYLALAPTTIVDGDNAEFATLGEVGGRAHPSGYPLYVLYLRAMSWLPGASPAHTAGLATCLLAALAVLVMHAACRAWGARPLAATLACAIYAASPVVLRMHVEAEVFAMNALAVALVLWLAAAAGPVRGVTRAGLLGLVAGLGMANHLTCVLVAPVGLLGVIRGIREARAGVVAAAAGLGGLALGLVPYAYLLVADGPASYGRVDGLADIVAFFLREEYGELGTFAPSGKDVPAATHLAAFASTVGRAWLWLPGLLALAALGVRSIHPRAGHEPPWGWRMLAVSFVLAGPLLVLKFNLEPVALGRYICQRFYLLPMLLLTIPAAIALDRVGDLLVDRVRLGAAFARFLALAGFFVLVAVALPRLRALQSPALDRGMRNMIGGLPPNAIAIVGGDYLCFGFDYVQHALGQRPDVDVICWGHNDRAWYRDRLAARGLPIIEGSARDQAIRMFATGRPVFMSSGRQLMLGSRRLPSYPHGGLVRVLPRAADVPSLPEIVRINRELFARYDLDYDPPGSDDDWASVVQQDYAATWTTILKWLEASGDHVEAEAVKQTILEIYPAAFE